MGDSGTPEAAAVDRSGGESEIQTGWTGKLRLLTRGEPQELAAWLREPLGRGTAGALVAAIVGGCALYGFALGYWRAPLQGVYVAIKLPCLVFLTLLVNGGINGMLGQLLGTGMSFRQTLVCCLMSFAIFSLLVGSLSPIVLLWVLDAPDALGIDGRAWYRYFLLVNTGLIALAGVIANLKLLRLIQAFTGNLSIGRRTLFAWLAGNLFVGAQLSFLFRPLFGNPRLPVQFLRPNPLEGNFYQTVWSMLEESSDTIGEGVRIAVFLAAVLAIPYNLVAIFRKSNAQPALESAFHRPSQPHER